MEVLFRNAQGALSQADCDYATLKVSKLERHLNAAHKAEIVHREENNGHHVEVTIFAEGKTVRAGHIDANIRAAVDLVSDKLDHQLSKLKAKLSRD